jgi:hypothetical protein
VTKFDRLNLLDLGQELRDRQILGEKMMKSKNKMWRGSDAESVTSRAPAQANKQQQHQIPLNQWIRKTEIKLFFIAKGISLFCGS